MLLYIIAIIILVVVLFGVHQKLSNAVCKSKVRLDGKTAVVTGGTSGLGLVIAKDFAKRGAKVFVVCPFEEEGINARKEIIEETGNQDVIYKHLDLASLSSVRDFVKEFRESEKRLDILVNNAGVGIPSDFMTKDGINFIMQVNYYGHFSLTLLLMPLLKKTGTESEPARIINMSSLTHRIASSDVENYNRTGYWYKAKIYSNSKLALVLFARELSRKLAGSNVIVNCSDPGLSATRIYKSANEFLGFLAITFILLLFKTPFEGAQSAIYLGVDDGGKVSGEYFANCQKINAASKAKNETTMRKLWEQSVRLVRITADELEEASLA